MYLTHEAIGLFRSIVTHISREFKSTNKMSKPCMGDNSF